MLGNFNQKQIEGMMRKMGISQEEIKAKRVIIEGEDKNIIIENPSVMKIKMSGNESFQITGEVSEEEFLFSDEEVKLVMEKTKKPREKVIEFLEKNEGDLAKTILDLNSV